MLHRVNVRDGQRVRHKRTRRGATARPDANADLARMLDQLGNDEEVGRVALHIDDVDLVVRALDVLLRHLPALEARLQTTHHFLAQPRCWGLPFRNVSHRHPVVRMFLPQLAVVTDTLRNPQGVIAGVRHCRVPQVAHLLS